MGVIQMKNKIIGSTILIVLIICMSIPNVLAYSDDLFEFDLPDNYANVSYQDMNVFTDPNNENRGMIIYSKENRNIKKSVWDIDRDDLKDLVNSLSRGSNVVKTEKRAKLGKEKAVEVVLSNGGDYIDLYILASNKYIYMVTFMGESETDLDNSDYAMVKKSFKLKDATTNFRLLYVIIALAVIGISAYLKYGKSSIYTNYNNHKKQETIDYKNLTEEDFKKM